MVGGEGSGRVAEWVMQALRQLAKSMILPAGTKLACSAPRGNGIGLEDTLGL